MSQRAIHTHGDDLDGGGHWGGSGIGRALAPRLARDGVLTATCDLHRPALDETQAVVKEMARQAQVFTFVDEVTAEAVLTRLKDEVAEACERDSLDLLIGDAGVAGGSSVRSPREEWERTACALLDAGSANADRSKECLAGKLRPRASDTRPCRFA